MGQGLVVSTASSATSCCPQALLIQIAPHDPRARRPVPYFRRTIIFSSRHIAHRERDAAGAVSGLAAPRERHPVGSESRCVIDHDGRRVEALRGVEGDADVLREDARLERDRQGVGDRDGLVQIAVRVDAGDRPEHLLGRNLGIRPVDRAGSSGRASSRNGGCRQARAARRRPSPRRSRRRRDPSPWEGSAGRLPFPHGSDRQP